MKREPATTPGRARDVYKYMQSLEWPIVRRLLKDAKKRGVGLSLFVRAVVVPEWIEVEDEKVRAAVEAASKAIRDRLRRRRRRERRPSKY